MENVNISAWRKLVKPAAPAAAPAAALIVTKVVYCRDYHVPAMQGKDDLPVRVQHMLLRK